MATLEADIEYDIRAIGQRLYREAGRHKPAFFASRGLHVRVFHDVLNDQALGSALFRFIDVLPQLESAREIAIHFQGGRKLAGAWARFLALCRALSAHHALVRDGRHHASLKKHILSA